MYSQLCTFIGPDKVFVVVKPNTLTHANIYRSNKYLLININKNNPILQKRERFYKIFLNIRSSFCQISDLILTLADGAEFGRINIPSQKVSHVNKVSRRKYQTQTTNIVINQCISIRIFNRLSPGLWICC